MRKWLSIQHLRVMLLAVLIGFPALGIVLAVLVGISARAGLGTPAGILVALLLAGALTLALMSAVMGPQRFIGDLESLEAGGGWATWPDGAGEVRIGPLGVLRRPGRYTAYAPSGALTKVEVVGGAPAQLVFTSTIRAQHGVTADRRGVTLDVPPGREDEARALAARFHREMMRG